MSFLFLVLLWMMFCPVVVGGVTHCCSDNQTTDHLDWLPGPRPLRHRKRSRCLEFKIWLSMLAPHYMTTWQRLSRVLLAP